MSTHHITHHVHPDPTNRHTLLHRATCTCGEEIAGTSSHYFVHDVTEEMTDKIRQHIPTPPDLRDHHTTVEYLPPNDEYMANCLCGWRTVTDTFTQAQDANTAHIAELGDRIAREWTEQFGGRDVRQTIRDAAKTRDAALPPLKEPGQPPTYWNPARHRGV